MKKLISLLLSWGVALSMLASACAVPSGEAAPAAAEAALPSTEATQLMAEMPITAEQLSHYLAQEYAYVALLGIEDADATVVKADFVQSARYEGMLLLRNKSSLRHASAISAQIPKSVEIFADEHGAYLIYGAVSIGGLQPLPMIVTLSPDRSVAVAIDSNADGVADLLMGGAKNLATGQIKSWVMANAAGDALWSCMSMKEQTALAAFPLCGSGSTTSVQPGENSGLIHTLAIRPALLSSPNCSKVPTYRMNPPEQPVTDDQSPDTTEPEDTQTIKEMVEEMKQTLQNSMAEMIRTLNPSTIDVEPSTTGGVGDFPLRELQQELLSRELGTSLSHWTEPTMPPTILEHLEQNAVVNELKKFSVELYLRNGNLVGGKVGYTVPFSPVVDPYGNPEGRFEDPRCHGQEISEAQDTLFMDKNFCKGADMLTCMQKVSDPISAATGGQCRIESGSSDEQKLVCDSLQQFWTQIPPSDNSCRAPADGPCEIERGPQIDQDYISLTPLHGVLAVKCWTDGCLDH